MKIVGFDPASKTGWAFINEGHLEEFGVIYLDSKLSIPQRLNILHLETYNILKRFNPDYVAIEDTIMCSSGVRIFQYLTRLNTIIIHTAYSFVKDRIKIYNPSYWKNNSLGSIRSISPKWRIQLEACKKFGYMLKGDYNRVEQIIQKKSSNMSKTNMVLEDRKVLITTIRKDLGRKGKNKLPPDKRKTKEDNLQHALQLQTDDKEKFKSLKGEFESDMKLVSNDIYSQSGISSDVADAISIGYCCHLELD